MKLNWNFLGGVGVQNKKPSVGGDGYFLELHIPAKQQDTGTQLAMPLRRCPFSV